MGIIQKQALRNTVINFVGAGFGAFTRLGMPIILMPGQIGLLSLLDAISGFFVTVFSMGFEQVLARMFPDYRDEDKGHHGFLLFGFFLSLIGIGLAWIGFYFFGDLFVKESDDGFKWYSSFAVLIFPMIFFRIVFRNIDGYTRMLFNTVIGVFLETFITKILFVLILMGFALSWFDYHYLVYFFVANMCLPGLVVLIYAMIKTEKISLPHKELVKKDNRKDLGSYILFGMLTGMSLSVVQYVDTLMVGTMISVEAVGFYITFFFAARLLVIPSRAINRISLVVLAESWKENDKENILDVYKKSCLNQMLLGAFLLGVGWTCIGPAMTLSPKYNEYTEYVYVFLFLGLGLLIEMSTGVNAAIISTSKRYRWETYFNLALTVLVIVFNYFLIQKYQLIGAAIASMLAMLVINFLRWLFLVKTYNLQPFDLHFLKSAIVAAGFISFCFFLDYEANVWLKLVINGVGLTILFWGVVILLKLSPDINQWLVKMKKKFVG